MFLGHHQEEALPVIIIEAIAFTGLDQIRETLHEVECTSDPLYLDAELDRIGKVLPCNGIKPEPSVP